MHVSFYLYVVLPFLRSLSCRIVRNCPTPPLISLPRGQGSSKHPKDDHRGTDLVNGGVLLGQISALRSQTLLGPAGYQAPDSFLGFGCGGFREHWVVKHQIKDRLAHQRLWEALRSQVRAAKSNINLPFLGNLGQPTSPRLTWRLPTPLEAWVPSAG